MKVIVAFELKNNYVKRMTEECKNSNEPDRDLSTPLGFFTYALMGGLIDYGLDGDDVEVKAYAVPDNSFLFKEDREDCKVKIIPPEKFEEMWDAL